MTRTHTYIYIKKRYIYIYVYIYICYYFFFIHRYIFELLIYLYLSLSKYIYIYIMFIFVFISLCSLYQYYVFGATRWYHIFDSPFFLMSSVFLLTIIWVLFLSLPTTNSGYYSGKRRYCGDRSTPCFRDHLFRRGLGLGEHSSLKETRSCHMSDLLFACMMQTNRGTREGVPAGRGQILYFAN